MATRPCRLVPAVARIHNASPGGSGRRRIIQVTDLLGIYGRWMAEAATISSYRYICANMYMHTYIYPKLLETCQSMVVHRKPILRTPSRWSRWSRAITHPFVPWAPHVASTSRSWWAVQPWMHAMHAGSMQIRLNLRRIYIYIYIYMYVWPDVLVYIKYQ